MAEREQQYAADESAKSADREHATRRDPTVTGHTWAQTISNALMVGATLAIVGITACYTHYAGRQIKPLRDSVAASTKAAEAAEAAARAAVDNAVAAKAQAQAALAAARAAETANNLANLGIRQNLESVRLDQRAWLSVAFTLSREPEEDSPLPENMVVEVISHIMNTGKTPAMFVRPKTFAVLAEQIPPMPNWNQRLELPAILPREMRDQILARARQSITVFPGDRAMTIVQHPIAFYPPSVAQYKKHQRTIYLWQRIEYCDVFGNFHWTQSCTTHVSPDALNLSVFNFCPSGGTETDDSKHSEGQHKKCQP